MGWRRVAGAHAERLRAGACGASPHHDPGDGARTAELPDLDPERAAVDPARKVRSQPRDQLRLAHVRRLLEAAGVAEPQRAIGGVIGLDADVVLWHDLDATTWPGGRTALTEYDERFIDRLAVARAAATRRESLTEPSRVLECRRCQWWPVCESQLTQTRDVSLVVRGEDAVELRNAGVSTVDKLAALNPAEESPIQWTGTSFTDAVALARAWLADLTVVRKVSEVTVPRADVEVDIDMESFGDSGAYLWGCLLSAPTSVCGPATAPSPRGTRCRPRTRGVRSPGSGRGFPTCGQGPRPKD